MADSDVLEQTSPADTETSGSDEDASLSEHEAAFSRSPDRRAAPTATEAPAEPTPPPAAAAEPAADTERDPETGKFQKRHRAKSQEASPEDVPRIAALTKRLREAEAERDALKSATRPVEPAPAAPKPAAPLSERFQKFEAWLALEGNAEKDFDDWLDAREAFNFRRLREAERADEARQTEERTQHEQVTAYAEQLAAAQKKYPDFEDVVSSAPSVSKAIEAAVIAVGPEAAYYLATHPEECEALTNDTLIDPTNPAFKAVVASTRRYLQTLVAPEQRSTSSTRTAADTTGAALATVPRLPNRPPTPVRTGAIRTEALPGDDSSLEDHERAFGRPRRRA
jgi:hypothetical protein